VVSGTFVVALAGAGAGLGLALSMQWLMSERPRCDDDRTQKSAHRSIRDMRTLVALGTGVIVALATGWPVAGLIGALATLTLVDVVQQTRDPDKARRIDAVAAWTELVRDTLAASAGLAEAIVGCAEVAPSELRSETVRLADRVSGGVPMRGALLQFADELRDPSADLVVSALVLATEARVQQLAELLSALAESIREEVAMRLRVEASRSAARSSVRTIVVFSVAFAAILAVLAHAYLAPFRVGTGQIVLVGVAALYASGVWLMTRLVRTPPSPRLLVRREEP